MKKNELIYDLSQIRAVNNSPVVLSGLINVMIETSNEALNTLQKGIENKQWKLVCDTCHKLKPSYRFIKYNHMTRNLEQMEALIENGNYKKTPSLLKEIREGIMAVNESLEEEIRNHTIK